MDKSPSWALLQALSHRGEGERRELRDALRRLGMTQEALDKALAQALTLLRTHYDAYRDSPPTPDVIVADDETEPYVSIRYPVPASPEEAAKLSWELHGVMVDRRLNFPGLTLAFAPAQDESRTA